MTCISIANFSHMKLFGTVILYNPNEDIVENIHSYIENIDKLYVVDNSDIKNQSLIKQIQDISDKCIYIDNNGNQGIAHALNIGADLAIQNGADWLLTMDQDSKFNDDDFIKFIQKADLDSAFIEKIGIVSPKHYEKDHYSKFYNLITMTSGNILNLEIFLKIDQFNTNFFIDSVDTEFCLKLNMAGYKIKRISNIVLNHNLGEIKNYNFFGFKFNPTNHSYIRRYYITRNRFYLWSKYKNIYPEFIKWEKKATFKELIKIILFEKEKWLKIKFSIKGYLDYKNNKFGKYEKE